MSHFSIMQWYNIRWILDISSVTLLYIRWILDISSATLPYIRWILDISSVTLPYCSLDIGHFLYDIAL